MIKHMNHSEYQENLKSKSREELVFIITDARAAIKAMPNGVNAGYYADEIHYAVMELNDRNANVLIEV
jgi:hypothetical protein